jgi:hypothetical protein
MSGYNEGLGHNESIVMSCHRMVSNFVTSRPLTHIGYCEGPRLTPISTYGPGRCSANIVRTVLNTVPSALKKFSDRFPSSSFVETLRTENSQFCLYQEVQLFPLHTVSIQFHLKTSAGLAKSRFFDIPCGSSRIGPWGSIFEAVELKFSVVGVCR